MTETIPTDDYQPEPARIETNTYVVELADGRHVEVAPRNPDVIRWETTAARRWPELLPRTDENGVPQFKAPVLMQTFTIWAALKRTNEYAADFETFRDTDCLGFEQKDDAEPVDPTPSAHEPGSLSS